MLGKWPDGGELAGQDDVAVQDGAGGVADRVLHVVALDEDGVEPGDAARRRGAGALQQPGQHREDARREAAGGRRLAGRQADLALREGHAGQAVHHQDDVAPRVAEPLGDPGGDEGRPQPHDRRLVRGRDDDDGAGQALGAEVVLEELPDLATTLADQGDDGDLGVGAAGDHRQQAGLADARTGHDAEALTATAGRQRVHGAYAEAQLLVDARAEQGVRGLVVDHHVGQVRERGAAVDRAAEAVQHPAAQVLADGDLQAETACLDVVADAETGRLGEGQAGEHTVLARHHLDRHRTGRPADLEQVAEGGGDTGDGDAEPEQAGDPAQALRYDGRAGRGAAFGGERAHESASRRRSRARERRRSMAEVSVSTTASCSSSDGVGDDLDAVRGELAEPVVPAVAGCSRTDRRRVLRQHGQHPGDRRRPTGVGGRGELVTEQGPDDLEREVGGLLGDLRRHLVGGRSDGGRSGAGDRRSRPGARGRGTARVAPVSAAATADSSALRRSAARWPSDQPTAYPCAWAAVRVRSARRPSTASVAPSPSTRSSPSRVQSPRRRSGRSADRQLSGWVSEWVSWVSQCLRQRAPPRCHCGAPRSGPAPRAGGSCGSRSAEPLRPG